MATVLVIEDDEANLELISSLVESFGNGVLRARDAHAGYDLVVQNDVHLILLDLRLPGMNGWEFASRMKNDAEFSRIPIVAVSVLVRNDDKRIALEAGCDDYLEKPFPLSALSAILKRYL